MNSAALNAELQARRRASLPIRRNTRRQANRERIHALVIHPIDTPRLIPDPLARRESRVYSAISGVRLIVAAIAIHGLVILGFALIGTLVGKHSPSHLPERLTVSIVESPRPEPPAPLDQPQPVEAPIVPEFEPIVPPKKMEPQRKLEKPVDSPAPVPKVEDATPVPRRVIGLNLESTVAGEGPAFAIGTSRFGRTATRANDPTQAQAAPSVQHQQTSLPTGQSGAVQRVAAHIPTRDTAFEKPKRLAPSRPDYPGTLKAQGIEGDVVVQVDIAADGHVTNVGLVRSSGQVAFDDAAKRAAALERFSPATRDGKPVAFTLTYSYRFRIED